MLKLNSLPQGQAERGPRSGRGKGGEDMARIKRVAALQDLSCFGRCSLTVVLPVLSAMGVQGCPLPTAVLSSHTGGFGPVARTELADQLQGTLEHWQRLGLDFDGVYTGYLSSPRQAALARRAVEALRRTGGMALVDPVLGDGGRLYASVTPELAAAMGELCQAADVITPNLTEAAVLLGRPPEQAREEPLTLVRMLSVGGRRSVVLTGVEPEPGQIGAAWFDREDGRTGLYAQARAPGHYPGTGDLFAAVLAGSLTLGEGLEAGVARAVDFVSRCARHTARLGTPDREGVVFEPLLATLANGPVR